MGSTKKGVGCIEEHFGELKDPRIDRTKRHELLDIVAIAMCAVICGADSWVDIELFGNSKRQWLERFLSLPNGIPSHDTFGRVFRMLDPKDFEQCFIEWVKAVYQLTGGQVIALDGKTARGSVDSANGKAAIHIVSAWASANRLVLAQTKVTQKSNEITAIPELLEILELSGCIVTIDAMGCQKQIAKQIVEKQADYVLALKANQRQLYEDVKDSFERAHAERFLDIEHDYHGSVSKDHGRLETRRCWTISDQKYLDYINPEGAWKNLASITMVTSVREVGDKASDESRYYISSLPGTATRVLEAIRTHWGIENSVHWVLDVAFDEDRNRARRDNAPQNLAIIRKIALNLLKQETTSKGGVKARRKLAGWNEDYLIKVLAQ